MILFTSLPRVGGHSTLTYGLCRMLRPHFDGIEVWCKVMPEHGHSAAVVGKLEELGCKVVMFSDEQGKVKKADALAALMNARRNRPDVFFTLAMRHLSVALAMAVGARNSVYYHITHDLNEGTIKRLNLYSKFFKKMVFICPATYDEFPGATRNSQFTWVPQSSEIPVKEPEKLAGERDAVLAGGNPPVRFGLIGRLTQDKGSAVMIEFVDTAKVVCELHVAGTGPFADAFKERSERKGNVTVKFYGAYDPTEREAFLRKFFAGIDLLLVPSQDAWETLSMATLESMQHGVPAMLCSTGGLVSFAHSQLGPASEEVVRLVEPKTYAAKLGELAARPRRPQTEVVRECREHYERYFNDAAVLQRWLDVLLKG